MRGSPRCKGAVRAPIDKTLLGASAFGSRYRALRKKMRNTYTEVGDLWRKGKKTFCGCCGGSVRAAGRDHRGQALAADGGAALDAQNEGDTEPGWLFALRERCVCAGPVVGEPDGSSLKRGSPTLKSDRCAVRLPTRLL